MKKLFLWLLAGLAGVAAAKAAHTDFSQLAEQVYTVEKKQEAEDVNDKKLQQSEQAQIFASEEEKKQRNRVEGEIAQLQMEMDEADRMRQRIIDSGCPPEGGPAPLELANRCNPQVDAHRALFERLKARIAPLKAQLDQVNELRDSISTKVAANAMERRRINGALADLANELDGLRSQAISQAIKLNAAAAQRACAAECCHRVIYDGADPKLCGIGLMCHSFQAAGLFGNAAICATVSSTTPVQVPEQAISAYKKSGRASPTANPMLDRATVPSPQKPRWDEAAYQRKVAEWQNEVEQNRQANEAYQRKLAEIADQHARDVAEAKRQHDNWERRVAACKAGDYTQCAAH